MCISNENTKMTDTTQITNTIFKSNKISFETNDDDYRFVKSTQKIKRGDLLLIEHCYSTDDSGMISNVILKSPELFDNLYPRKMSWNENFIQTTTDELLELCNEKAQKNSFGRNGVYSIGLDISRFNHSNTPNSSVQYLYLNTAVKDTDVCCRVLYVYAHCDINTDEEITIWYSKGYINEYFNENVQEYIPSFKLETNYIQNVYFQYIKKDICKNIMFNHICIYYGLYLINDILSPTPRFLEYFTKNIKKECNTQNIINWMIEQKNFILIV